MLNITKIFKLPKVAFVYNISNNMDDNECIVDLSCVYNYFSLYNSNVTIYKKRIPSYFNFTEEQKNNYSIFCLKVYPSTKKTNFNYDYENCFNDINYIYFYRLRHYILILLLNLDIPKCSTYITPINNNKYSLYIYNIDPLWEIVETYPVINENNQTILNFSKIKINNKIRPPILYEELSIKLTNTNDFITKVYLFNTNNIKLFTYDECTNIDPIIKEDILEQLSYSHNKKIEI